MKTTHILMLTLGLLAFVRTAALGTECDLPGDVNLDGNVDLADYGQLAACLAGPGEATPPPDCSSEDFAQADTDDDGDVDLGDFNELAHNFGLSRFPYGPHRENVEAEMLAMDLSGALRAPDKPYDRILRDLQLIREAYPELVTVIDDPDYMPNELLIGLDTSGSTEEYDALNEYYFVIDEEVHTSFRVLTFCDNLNAPVLAELYAAVPEVDWADPNWFIGIDDYITITEIGDKMRYDIDDGFHDCFDGCDCHRLWVIDVDLDGVVTLVSYTEEGYPWCEF
jgi:hypothetical protein